MPVISTSVATCGGVLRSSQTARTRGGAASSASVVMGCFLGRTVLAASK